MTHIVNFPARFAFVNPDGTLTMEAMRMLRGWFERIGEATGISADDLAVLAAFSSIGADVNAQPADAQIFAPADHGAAIAELRKEIDELRQMLAFSAPPLESQKDVYDAIF